VLSDKQGHSYREGGVVVHNHGNPKVSRSSHAKLLRLLLIISEKSKAKIK